MQGERLRLWEEFNYCWLAALQKQKDLLLEMQRTGQALATPQTLMEVDFLKNMGNELVRLCDSMEKHGLVDYQMGVWEETILDREHHEFPFSDLGTKLTDYTVLMQCLDLMEEQNAPVASSGRRR